MPGFKDFVNGTVVDETDLDDLLMRQTVMRFTSASARDAALTAGIVSDGMVAVTTDTDQTWTRINGAWKPMFAGERGTITATTDAGGKITISHGLAVVPATVFANVQNSTLYAAAGAPTSTSVDVFVRDLATAGVPVKASTSVTIRYLILI